MSDKTINLSAAPMRWYSVAIRFFAPSVTTQAFIYFMTIPATKGDEAVELARAYFARQAYDLEAECYRMPDGTPIEMWHVHALEIPPPYSDELHKQFRASLDAIAAQDEPKSESASDDNNVLPFPPHPKPDDPEPSKT